MDYLHELLKELDSTSNPPKHLISRVFKALRKSKIRRPDVYAVFGPSYCSGLGEVERYAFYENIFTASLDFGDIEQAEKYLDLLIHKFPDSSRVKRLQGMLAESTGDFDGALKIYSEILEGNPSNLLVMKRKAAALRSQGKNKLCVEALHDIVKLFQSDVASWLELADIHLSLCDYQAAAFCYEEVLLLTPTSSPIYCRLAEVLYTLGGGENLIKARQYYSISLNHQKARNNRRALYGQVVTCREILSLPHKKIPEGEMEVTVAMRDWCLEQLQNMKIEPSNAVGDALIATS